MLLFVEPFTSNDTYICPDCGSEVRVGSRSCPGCGPFRAMEPEVESWGGDYPSVTNYSHSHTAPLKLNGEDLPPKPLGKTSEPWRTLPRPKFAHIFVMILIGLTLLSVAMAAARMFLR